MGFFADNMQSAPTATPAPTGGGFFAKNYQGGAVPSPTPTVTPPPENAGKATPPVGEGSTPAVTPPAPAGGSGYGAASSTDPFSGRPLLTYPLKIPATFMSPETTATQVDTTRVAPSFDPTKAQPLTHDQLVNERMPESVSQSLRAKLGAQAYQELDHVVPLSELGSNLQSNLRLENAKNGGQAYNPGSNPTPTDPEELKIYDQIRNGSISLLQGWQELAKLKGVTLPEDRAQNNPLNQFLLMHGGLLKTLAGVQGVVEGILHPQGSAAAPTKPGTARLLVTTTPFANGVSNVIPDIGPRQAEPDILRAPTPEEAAQFHSPTPEETIANAENAQEQLGLSPGMPLYFPFGGKTMVPNNAMYGNLKYVVELPEKSVNTIADFSAGLLNTAGEVMGAPNEGEALREHMNAERVPSILQSSVGTFDALRNAGYDNATAIALAALQAGAEGGMDVATADMIWGAGASTAKDLFLPQLKTDMEQLAAWERLGKPKTLEEAKIAQKNLAHQFHPDVAGGSTAEMAAINMAYDVLAEKGIPVSEKSFLQKIFSKYGKQINDAADVVRAVQKRAGYLPSGEPPLSEANAASAESNVGFSESKSMTLGTSEDVAGLREPSGATESTTSLPPLDQAEKSTKNTLSPERMNFAREFSMHPDEADIHPGNPIIAKYLSEVQGQEPNHLAITNHVANELGGTPYARVKSLDSLKAKLARRPWAKIADIGDMHGSSVVVPADKVDAAIELAKANARITNVDDFRKNPDFLGYRAVHLDVEHPNGMVGELQIHGGDDAFARKEYAHEIYDRWRKYIEMNRQAGTVTEHGIPTDVWDKVPLEERSAFLNDVFHSRDIFSGKAPVPESYIKKAQAMADRTALRSKELKAERLNAQRTTDTKALEKKKYYVRDLDGEGDGFREVKGKPVQIKKGLDTFIHKSKGGDFWLVSEGRSGAFISEAKTQAAAIANAKQILKERAGQVEEAIKSRIENFGLSPRYDAHAVEIPKEIQPIADLAREYPDYDDFKAAYHDAMSNPEFAKANDAFMSASKKGIDAGYRNTKLGSFRAENGIDSFKDLHSFVNGKTEAANIPPDLQPLAEEARKYKSAEEFANANKGSIVIRQGEVGKGGAYFATGEGGGTYFDPLNEGAKSYDVRGAKIVSSDTPEAKAVIAEALKDPTNTVEDIKQLKESLSDGFINYGMNDNIPSIVKAAKKLGYDGIKVWEADSVGNPDSLFLWNTDKAKPLGNLTDFYNQATKGAETPSIDEATAKLQKANEVFAEMQARKGATTLASGVNPGLDKFLQEDVKPTLQGLGEGFTKAVKEITNIVAPRVGANPKALDLIYENFGGRNKAEFIMEKTLEKLEKTFDRMPQAEQIAFIDRIKRGTPQPSPELQAVADMLRKIDTDTYAEVQKLKPTAVFKENHYRVLWKKIPGAEERKGFAGLFRRPLEGSKGFLKKATLIDMSEGIAKGGVPYSYNPITMARVAYADEMKFITARRMFETAKQQGLAKFIKIGDPTPEGFARVNDRIARVYLPVETVEPFEGHALTQRGEWVFEQSFARLVNNHLSRDWIRTTAIGNSLMAIKNATTAIELSLSAFHAVFETLETASSQMGLGIRKIVNMGLRGDMKMLKSGIKDIFTSPGAPISTAKLGAEAKKFIASKYVDQTSPALAHAAQQFIKKFPDAAKLLDDLFLGGGRLAISRDYAIETDKTFMQNIYNQNYVGAALRMLPALNAELYKPLFNHYIPNLKIGMFLNEYSYALIEREADLAAGKISRAALARQVWDFVENRLGEMNFQNLFWNNTFKSTMQLFFRSVTWKLGNIRAFAGGSVNQVKEIVDAIRAGRVPKMTQEMAWAFSLAAMTATMAAIIMRAMTGKNPQSTKDLVYPQIDPNDETKRLSMPTYMRDVVSLAHSPGGYVQSSMSSEIGRMIELWQNRDFYGTEIYNPNDPWSTQALDATLQLVPLPFSVQNMTQPGTSAGQKAAGFLGFTQAPAYIRNTGIQQAISDLYQTRFGGGTQTQEQAAANTAKANIRAAYYAGDTATANQLLQQAMQKGYITQSGLSTFLRDSDLPADIRRFARFDAADQIALYRQMSLDELKRYGFEAKPGARAIFSSISPAAAQFVQGMKDGSITAPHWVKGRDVNQSQ